MPVVRPVLHWGLVLAGCSLLACFLGGCFAYWSQAEEFRTGLECGQSLEEVRNLASRYGASDFNADSTDESEAYSLFLFKRDTLFHFWFEDNTLSEYQEGRYIGPKELELSVRTNLCSGAMSGSPTLKIVAPAELRDAVVTLDGIELPASWTDPDWPPTMEVGIPFLSFGVHELRLRKLDGPSVVRAFEYRPTEYWPAEQQILIQIESDELTSVP